MPFFMRSLYGLKQAPHAWFQRFASFVTRIDFQHTLLQRIIALLHSEFAMIDLGSLNYFLGISAQRLAFGIFLSQSKFTRKFLSELICRIVCLYMHDPRDLHFTALKRILRYVRACCPVTRRSTSGYCVFLGDILLSWSTKRHVTLSRSSAEAEYRGVANVVVETGWIRNLLRELQTHLFTTTLVYCDNVSAVYMSANPVQHQRTKHIEIDIHFVRDFVASGQVRVLHVPSRFQYADIFTKGLPTALFLEFRTRTFEDLPLTLRGGIHDFNFKEMEVQGLPELIMKGDGRASKQKFDGDAEFKMRAQQAVVSLQGGDQRVIGGINYASTEPILHYGQREHFDMFFTAAKRAGWLPAEEGKYPRTSHVGSGLVLGEDIKRFELVVLKLSSWLICLMKPKLVVKQLSWSEVRPPRCDAEYLSKTAEAVVGSPEETSRLLLCEATAVVMRKCFHLLGITPVYKI
ncbi:ribonuclease H-like domain-containing protein [Tanacetum coccineum]